MSHPTWVPGTVLGLLLEEYTFLPVELPFQSHNDYNLWRSPADKKKRRKNMQMYPLPTPFPLPYKNTVNCRESSGDFLHLAPVWLVLAPVAEWLMREYCGAPSSQMERCWLTQRQQCCMLIILQEFAAGGPMKTNTSEQREPSEYRVARG